ncbi:MAG: 16S rRNA (adenine(1518)-N(6)/adenine(1519)-N(6))-dimethyltransferase RsmA [Smithellaceae bacterium]
MATPRDILQLYDIKPKKRLGQSFLVDVNTIKKIAASALISADDVVVEIGAGIGVMTREIAQIARRVIAVEIDPKLVATLREQLVLCSNVEIHSGDVLKFDFASISDKYNSKVKVVGNIPYNISSPVIFHLLSFRSAVRCFTLMLQKEVVQRLVSVPDNKHYGVPSVMLQMFAEVERLFDVPATCFFPRPNVESSIIQGTFREKPLMELADETFFSRLVKSSFAQRRKMLINNLKNAKFLEGLSDVNLQEALEASGIDGKRRGETLSVEEFGLLSNILKYRLTNPR